MKLNLITEPIADIQLPNSTQYTHTYCSLDPGSNGISVGLRNISAKITIAAKTAICQVHLTNMVPKLYDALGQMSTETNQEEDRSWILDKLDLAGLQQWTEDQQHVAKGLIMQISWCIFQKSFGFS